jgi:adenylate kinase
LFGAPATPHLFSSFGVRAKQKMLVLGFEGFPSGDQSEILRSLNIEHVSPAELIRLEISRRSPLGFQAERAIRQGSALADETLLAVMRRWFWARKPDAGFALTGFPATLLQAKVFDEWLDARDENLDAVLVADVTSANAVISHYRTLGLLNENQALARV